MGQQQLLLLVLSTVIVGLATVAGIQAFSEGQQQAAQEALVQRATQLGQDLHAASQQPSQMGGITIGGGNSDVAGAIGQSSRTGIAADGAGDGAECDIDNSSDPATVDCGTDGANGGDVQVDVQVDPDTDSNTEPVMVTSINVTS